MNSATVLLSPCFGQRAPAGEPLVQGGNEVSELYGIGGELPAGEALVVFMVDEVLSDEELFFEVGIRVHGLVLRKMC